MVPIPFSCISVSWCLRESHLLSSNAELSHDEERATGAQFGTAA
jgi:hypothetical protein